MGKLSDWIEGEIISWKEHTGYVNFISEHYITMCIREYDKPEEIATQSKRNTNQVCVIIYPQYWHEVERDGQK